MHYVIDNWAFNPGSTEVTNISEYRETRGVFLVEVDEQIRSRLSMFQDYRQRPFQRISFDVDGYADTVDLTRDLLEKVSRERRTNSEIAPIIEITLRGQLGFPNSLIETKRIRSEARKETGALHIRLKNVSVPVEYAVAGTCRRTRVAKHLERRVVEDLILRDNRFKTKSGCDIGRRYRRKEAGACGEEASQIAEYLLQVLNPPQTSDDSGKELLN
jgi:DNA repair exonuclease SbcCD nuclease subunit